jgi:eukaryotic-like serine/threonine-protein kinase
VSSVAIPSTRDLVLGRYRPVRPLGSGGSGSVWLACDEHTGLEVALKIIAREGKAAARAEREALAARRLRHERCVRAYDVGHDAGHVYIAYEYVAGRTLREALRMDALTDEDCVEVAAQVLDALAHAHRTGIVHRDVKPSNILLEHRDGVAARLLDFGLAQFDGADTLTAIGDVPGTLAYIAPERLAGAEAEPESDVWSLGVVLWESLSGRHPFWGLPLQEVAAAIQAGAPPLAVERRDLPRRLLTAVDGALARDADARPRASELASQLRAALRAAPERKPRARRRSAPSATTTTTRPAPRALAHTRILLPAGLAAVTALMGATLLPFWPPALVAALVLGAALATWMDPRIGLAIALATPVFPIGNASQAAAILYCGLAAAWLAVTWRDARAGLLFVTGPLLAPLGLLAVVPLAVQPARGVVRRAAHGAVAVIAAALTAWIAGDGLPPAGDASPQVDIAPVDGLVAVVSASTTALASAPLVLAAAGLAAAAAALLPFAHRRSRYGVLAVGATLVVSLAAAGAGVAAMLLAALVWGVAGAVGARARG